jgi:hypothetical protein
MNMIGASTVPVFDEAARLYVQYLPVVQEMERAFGQAVDKFLSDVRQAIDGQSSPLKTDDEVTGKYRVWWLTRKQDAPEHVPYVWFEYRKTEIVSPGQFEFTVEIEPEAKSLRPEVEKALRKVELPAHCERKKKAAYGGIATYVVPYGESADAVQDVAQVLVLVLKAIEPFKKR